MPLLTPIQKLSKVFWERREAHCGYVYWITKPLSSPLRNAPSCSIQMHRRKASSQLASHLGKATSFPHPERQLWQANRKVWHKEGTITLNRLRCSTGRNVGAVQQINIQDIHTQPKEARSGPREIQRPSFTFHLLLLSKCALEPRDAIRHIAHIHKRKKRVSGGETNKTGGPAALCFVLFTSGGGEYYTWALVPQTIHIHCDEEKMGNEQDTTSRKTSLSPHLKRNYRIYSIIRRPQL